jgi:hypothetical protein
MRATSRAQTYHRWYTAADTDYQTGDKGITVLGPQKRHGRPKPIELRDLAEVRITIISSDREISAHLEPVLKFIASCPDRVTPD